MYQRKKGTLKKAVPFGTMIKDFGLENDAHAGKWHRQISLLAVEAVQRFSAKYKIDVPAGAFGENLLVEGIDLKNLPVGTKLKCNDIILEITQIGKNATSAAIFKNRPANVSCRMKAFSPLS